jgi:hypothetical protein
MSVSEVGLYIVDSLIIILIIIGCCYKSIDNNYSINEIEKDNNYLNYKSIEEI